jgi:hypothetical protein
MLVYFEGAGVPGFRGRQNADVPRMTAWKKHRNFRPSEVNYKIGTRYLLIVKRLSIRDLTMHNQAIKNELSVLCNLTFKVHI